MCWSLVHSTVLLELCLSGPTEHAPSRAEQLLVHVALAIQVSLLRNSACPLLSMPVGFFCYVEQFPAGPAAGNLMYWLCLS